MAARTIVVGPGGASHQALTDRSAAAAHPATAIEFTPSEDFTTDPENVSEALIELGAREVTGGDIDGGTFF
jgi:hypothetical protein